MAQQWILLHGAFVTRDFVQRVVFVEAGTGCPQEKSINGARNASHTVLFALRSTVWNSDFNVGNAIS
jgi:hypothetical protein